MTPERWKQIDTLYHAALEVEAKERNCLLDQACADDAELRAEVESLLATHEQAGSFLGKPAMEDVAQEFKAEPPTLLGRKLGPFQVLSLIGAGGMGEVYKAKDTRLNRTVAIKVLPRHLAEQPERRQRFEREARTIAGLNHPHICALHDIGRHDGVDFLVMEYLEGQQLSQRLKRGPLPLAKLLEVAIQVAGALEQAHRKGVIHRDVKPGNIMLTEEGAKLLDFGLAKRQPVAASRSKVASATESESLTDTGMVLGTLEYMAPEQVEGKEADARTDIFALGTVIYEMAIGRKAFEGTSQTSLIAAILDSEPPSMTDLQPLTPPALEHLVRRCLAKDPNERWQSARDLEGELKWVAEGRLIPKARKKRRWTVVSGLGFLVAIALGITWWQIGPKEHPGPTRLRRVTWDMGLTTDPALSPDGKWLAYASDRSGEGNLDIWVQQIAGGEPRGEPVRLTRDLADDSEPNFSPDGSQVAFTSARNGGGIYLISTTGDPGQERLLVKQGRRPRFSPDGRFLAYWVGSAVWQLFPKSYILPLSGGPPQQLQPTFGGVAFPSWSPDGKHLLFCGWREDHESGDATGEGLDWWVTSAEGGTAIQTGLRQFPQAIYDQFPLMPEWTSQGKVVFPRLWQQDNADLWQVQISPTTFRVEGTPERLTSGTNVQIQSTVASGYLAFAGLSRSANIYALRIDHSDAKVQGETQRLTQDTSLNGLPSISADGKKLVYTSVRAGDRNGWIKDLKTGSVTALTPGSARLYLPQLTADGSKVAYRTFEVPKFRLFVANTNDLVPRLLCEDCDGPASWFPDGLRLLLYASPSDWKRIDAIDVNAGERTQVLQYSHEVYAPHVSPDSRWMAVQIVFGATRESIIVIPLRNGVASKEEEWVTVTDGSGNDQIPNWSPEGNLLYFFSIRDGSRCIWVQRLEPSSKKPIGTAFPVYHSHDPSRSIKNILPRYIYMSVSRNQIVFPMGELTGNIWITEFRH